MAAQGPAVPVLLRLVAAFLALFALFALPAAASPTRAPPTLYHNATVYTVSSPAIADAFVVHDGVFIETGSFKALSRRHYHAHHVDLGGLTVIPGLIDSHAHLFHLGYSLTAADLVGARSLDDVRARLVAYLDANPDTTWLVGNGWDHTQWGNAAAPFPTSADLDAHPRLASVPIVLYRIDYHAVWLNKRALDALGTLPATVKGGEIIRDATSGAPTGVFLDNAMDLVDSVSPTPSESQMRRALRHATDECLKYGITTVHDAGIPPSTIEFYRAAARRGDLPLRIFGMATCAARNTVCDIEPFTDPSGRLTVRAVKLFVDGALGSWGAALDAPYSDRPSQTGLMRLDDDALLPLIEAWTKRGFQVGTHAIGDRANRVTIDAYEHIIAARPGADLRFRIEHAQILSQRDIARVGALGILPCVQPTHATSDMGYAEARLGPERIKGAYAWRSLIRAGASRLPLSSDFPVERVNPMLGIFAAVERTDASGAPEGGWKPEERLSRVEALKGFTSDAAYAAFQEKLVGRIARGMKADFVVVDRDFMRLPAAQILETKVAVTMIDGECAYYDEESIIGRAVCTGQEKKGKPVHTEL